MIQKHLQHCLTGKMQDKLLRITFIYLAFFWILKISHDGNKQLWYMPYFRSKWSKINIQWKRLIYEGEPPPPFRGDYGIWQVLVLMLTARFDDKAIALHEAEIRSNIDVYYSATQINIQVFVNLAAGCYSAHITNIRLFLEKCSSRKWKYRTSSIHGESSTVVTSCLNFR